MLWLVTVLLLLPMAPQQGEARCTDPLLEVAMVGYSPTMANVIEQPDKGRKSTIFIPWQQDPIYVEKKEDVVNGFVDIERQTQCHPSLTEAVVRNYEAYKRLSSGVLSFATEGSAATPLGAAEFSFKEKAGYGNLNNPNDRLLRGFFNESEGEGRFIKVECVTHTVRILPFHEPVFTPAFTSALHVLQEAAMNANYAERKKVFSEFVRSYGTHFARTTQFGYESYFAKLFATQPKTPAEEAVRRRCMMESAKETMTTGARRGCEMMSQQVFQAAPGRCGEEDVKLMMPEIGMASASGVEDCDSAANASPRPVAYVLEEISALFEESWIESQMLERNQIRLNGTTLSKLFEEQMGSYSQDVIEEAETSSRNLCTWGRSIIQNASHVVLNASPITADRAEEEEKSSSADNGGIIIVGGYPSSTANSLALFMPAPPPLPVEVAYHTLSLVGSALFSCGGYGSKSSDREKCWHIETGTQDTTWDSFDIPWSLYYHSAVVVQDDIWFFSHSKLRILHTKNTPKTFTDTNLGFSFGSNICAVAHGSQIFVIGVGEGKDEIYVNSNSSQPEQWKRFSHLIQGRDNFNCLGYGAEVFVTGGDKGSTDTTLSSAEAINVVDGTVRRLGSMGGTREDHRMAIIQGRPAVLGGYNETNNIATIETYDNQTNSWEALDLSLSEPRCCFGLVQFPR